MTAGFLSLGSVDGYALMEDSFSGFDYDNSAQVVPLLGDGTSTYNAVLQQSAPTVRKARVGFVAETADVLVIRGYYESRETVVFADVEGNSTNVRLLEFTRDYRGSGLWSCTLVLIEADTAPAGPGVGVPVAGLATTLAADAAIGATNLKVASVTTVTAGQFVRVGEAGATATATNSEVVRVLTVGTTGAGGTGLGIESDTGGGLVLARASADEVKTATGTQLAAAAAAGAVNVKVDSVTGITTSTNLRIGYLGHYEYRTPTAVGTAGAAGTGITFAAPLARDHGLDAWVVVVA